jgi:hypothetical protein
MRFTSLSFLAFSIRRSRHLLIRVKGFVNVSFINVTGIKAAVGVIGVVLLFHSVKDWLGREWDSGLYQETCKLYGRIMRLLDHEEENKKAKIRTLPEW